MKRRNRRKSILDKKMLVTGGIALAVVVMVLMIVYFVLVGTVNKVDKDTIGPNIFIENVNVSGLSKKDAKKVLGEQLSKYQDETVKLVAEDSVAEVTLGELGFQLKDMDQLLKKAVAYGKDGSLWNRYQTLKKLEEGAKHFDATYEIDSTVAKATINEKMPELENAAKNATIKRVNNAFVITDGQSGKKIELEESVKKIEEHFNNKWKHQGTETVQLITVTDEPDITREQLEKIQHVLGTYNTWFASNNNRGKNVALATSRINGTVLMPGEEYSVSTGMGSRNKENGYFEAGSYENGQTVQTYGGGICQVSSTLYNALLLAEMEITERWPHSMTVDYVKASMDAAIAEGLQDLKFKNNTDAPIYIEGVTVGGKLTFTVYGQETRSTNRKVSYVSEIISQTAAKKKFVASNDAVGILKQSVAGHNSVKAKLWKVVKENGVEVSRTQVNTSSYQMSAATWVVGTATDNAEAKAVLTAAINTQDEAQIKAAIEQAKQIIANASQPVTPPTQETPSGGGNPGTLTPSNKVE